MPIGYIEGRHPHRPLTSLSCREELPLLLGLLTAVLSGVGPHDLASASEPPPLVVRPPQAATPQGAVTAITEAVPAAAEVARAPASKADQMLSVSTAFPEHLPFP